MEMAGLGSDQQVSPNGRDPGHNSSGPSSRCATDHLVGDGAPGAHLELQVNTSSYGGDTIAQQHFVSPDHRPPNRRRLTTQIVEVHERTGITDASRGPAGGGTLAKATTGATGRQTGRSDVMATPSSSPGQASLPSSWQLRKTVLLNSGNQCYLNSLALAILHTCLQDHVWQGLAGDFAPALQAILACHRPQSLRNLYAWQMALRG